MEILLATANQGKIRELEDLLKSDDTLLRAGVKILSLNDFPDLKGIEENGRTFAENALIKAREAYALGRRITLADDSGLEVDALNGAPGVFSARYAGQPKDDARNIEKLLAELKDIPREKRTARFRCCLAVIDQNGREYILEGKTEGQILEECRGSGGFGYDPVFYLPQFGKTMAELTLEEKNKISHRARAFQQVIPLLRKMVF